MQDDDFSTFWRNDTHVQGLFYDLLARSKQNAYDDDFLMQLAAYRKAAPTSERADIFAAKYLLHHGDIENAAVCAERAREKRPLNYEIWKILAVAYKALHREMDSIDMQGLSYGLYQAPKLALNLTPSNLQEGLGRLTIALGHCPNAPTAESRAYVENGALCFRHDVFLGEELPLTMPAGSARFWSAVYTENAFLSDHSRLMEDLRHQESFIGYGHRDFLFDLQKATEVRGTAKIELPPGEEAIIPIAGTAINQPLAVTTESLGTKEAYLGKWAFSFFRFSESATLHASADAPYAVGTPIRLGHSPQRRKLVLNLFVDGLSWAVARPYAATHLPNVMRFFSRGVIFDQHFSTSEYTLPAHPAIETGYYPHHTQIFNEKAGYELPLHMTTISEQMKEQGYYCAAPLACTNGISHGILRGFDRLIASGWTLNSVNAVDSAIRHLKAFDEADLFLFLLANDVHPYDALDFKFDTAVETHMALSERIFNQKVPAAAVRLPSLYIHQEQYLERIRQVDRNLGQLFSYLETHFSEDEYLVNLYSDHGVSIFNNSTAAVDVISENSTHAAWMMRGAGVPEGVVVHDLTSTVDIYPTLGHLCGFPVNDDIDGRLPAIFGGTARDAAYSMSMFPGQTYKLAVRNHEHVLRLETREVLDEDGTVDFTDARVGIYPRAHELEEDYALDSAELRAFFYPRARDFVREIANNGEFWPSMRAARPEWFGEQP
ncbi:sulfatase-like hydrolase/transferase [uncultured Selenomonas sp.]|uniref:sulfatase-like hydrolase/transferase n=1 Tax=uncultured Selenomonas sp. TaxID=159275 RepID=UPI0028EAC5C9|nr:sulfatase-like hydrolase/transferase [uncultured Selenomonas sp.]